MVSVTSSEARAPKGACPLDMNRRLLMGFLNRLQTEPGVLLPEGGLDQQRLYAMAEDYLAEGGTRSPAPVECLKLHDAVLWEDRRHRPFERLLARRFSHLLPKRVGDEGSPSPDAPLSRRLIPGLMAALAKMVGPETLDDVTRRTSMLLDRHREARLGLVNWTQLAAEPEADVLLSEVLMAAARHFQDIDRRVAWLVQVINSHLAVPLPEDRDPAWRCDAHRARLLLRALYAPLKPRLCEPEARAILRRRHGDPAVSDAIRLVAALDA